MKPLILLDVDGVLNPDFTSNAWNKRHANPAWIQEHVTVNGFTYKLYLNKTHGEKLLVTATAADADLAWGTTWNQHANVHVGPVIGLPELPVFHAAHGHKPDTVLPALSGRRFVWLDDERYVTDAASSVPGGHGIWVDSRSGLQDCHLHRVVKLLKENNEPE